MLESLGRLFTRNPHFKLLALALSFGAWFYVQGSEVHDTRIRARVLWDLPAEFVTVGTPPSEVTLYVRGTRTATRRAREAGPSMPVDARRLGVGMSEIALDAQPIQDFPSSVELVRVEPSTIRVELDERLERKVALVPVLVGEPAPGYTVSVVRLEPAVVTVSGPRVTLEGLRDVDTTSIDISGLRADMATQVSVDLPRNVSAPRKEKLPTVTAFVEVAPNLERRVLGAVPVEVWRAEGWKTSASEVSVTLEGPAAVVRQLTPEEVVAFVHVPEGGERARFDAPFGPREGPRLRILHPGGDQVTVVKVEPGLVEAFR